MGCFQVSASLWDPLRAARRSHASTVAEMTEVFLDFGCFALPLIGAVPP